MKILVIRRDNIGDLVCTTPLFRALRKAQPEAWIGALVTRYNAEVLHGNPDVDAVFAYQKAKHRTDGESALGIYAQRLRQIWQLRRLRLDAVLLPAAGPQQSVYRMARWIAPGRLIDQNDTRLPSAGPHEVACSLRLLAGLELPAPDVAPATLVLPNAAALAAVRQRIAAATPARPGPVIGIHISSRKPAQRWPAAAFIALITQLAASPAAPRMLLFWSPGDENNPVHPGEDGKAKQILDACAGLPVLACATRELRDLIAGLAATDAVICSDGGHMHLAAGLGKPIVCFFGNSDPARWHPWGVPYRLLRKPSSRVADVGVDEVVAAFSDLMTNR